MKLMIFAVLYALTYLTNCMQIQGTGRRQFKSNILVREINFIKDELVAGPETMLLNCTYMDRDSKFVNLTISKDKTVFYSYNASDVNNPEFHPIEGIDHIIQKHPGAFIVENVSDSIEGQYSCTVSFSDSETGVITNSSAKLRVFFTTESEMANMILKSINETVQDALKLSNKLQQFAKSKNEKLKQDLVRELETVLEQNKYLRTDEELDDFIKVMPLMGQYVYELYNANLRLVVKYAYLAKLEVNKH